MNVIYFDDDCKRNAKEYAKHAKAQELCNKISSAIDKTALILCSAVSIFAIIIMTYVLI